MGLKHPDEKPPSPPAVAVETEEKTPRPLADAIGLTKFAFAVPENVYGVACMVGILSPDQSLAGWFRDCGECYFRLFLNHILQAFFLVTLYQLDLWQLDSIDSDDCFAIRPYFFIINTWIFFAVVLTEMEETLNLAQLVLRCVPSVPGKSQCLEFIVEQDGPVLARGGMSRRRKALVTLIVLVPKLVIAICLLIFGGLFLASASGNIDMLLNSLAVVFIIELDELIYGFMTPPRTRRLIAECPQFQSDKPDNLFWAIWLRGAFYIKFFVSGVLVAIFYTTGPVCQVDTCEGAIRACPVI